MDWTSPINALIPGVEGQALYRLFLIDQPQTIGEITRRSKTASYSGFRFALERLTEQGLVRADKIGPAYQYRLNTHHLAYPALKAALELYDPYGDLRERLASLARTTWPSRADQLSLSIYGSVATRKATTDSDLDLLLITPRADQDSPERQELVEALHTEPEKWTGNPVHLYTAAREDLGAMYAKEDPIITSWLSTADTVTGPSVADLIKQSVLRAGR